MPEDDDAIADAIEQNATGPRKVAGETGSTEMHPLKDQIAADAYRRSVRAARRGFGGLRHIKLVPPGQD